MINKIALFLFVFLLPSSFAAVQTPYAKGPNQIEFGKGYCENKKEEAILWNSILDFSESVRKAIPNIPPEQKSYIEGEINSGNSTRAMNVSMNDFFKIQQVITISDNLLSLSKSYLKYQDALSPHFKMEFIGRTLTNTLDLPFEWNDINELAADLNKKSFIVDPQDLRGFYMGMISIKQAMPFHLICYGKIKTK